MNLLKLKNKFIAIEGIDGCGKSTLSRRLYNILAANNIKTYLFSISDLCKTGHMDNQVHVEYQYIMDFDSARERLLKTLNLIKNIKKTGKEDILCYDKLMKDYFNVMRVYSKILRTYLDTGFTVIADRWYFSTLAYNNILYGTLINKLISFKGYETTSLLLIDNSKEAHDVCNENLNFLKPNFESILNPEYFIYISLDVDEALKRIECRGKETDEVFETKEKQLRVVEGFNCVLNTIKTPKKDCYEYLFKVNNLIEIDGSWNQNDILRKINENIK